MSRARWIILLVGPLPILAVSWLISNWCRDNPGMPPAANHVFGLPAFSNSARAEEPGVRSNRPIRHAPASLSALCQDSAKRLKDKLGEALNVVVHPPYVIAGDMTTRELNSWYERTIRPASEAMAHSYFDVSPSQPITVLLFSKELSYNENAKALFGDGGISVYGYYKPQNRTLVMNIDTGGGTLVHELTHALADFDFPDIPDWFNEGLASLHEQCRFREGDQGQWVEGLENWRLPGLQKAIQADRLRPLKTMIEANDFRGELEGINYAQARYFCMYLQRKQLLDKFYRNFREQHATDPLGIGALEDVLQIRSWQDLDQDFRKWVLTLRR